MPSQRAASTATAARFVSTTRYPLAVYCSALAQLACAPYRPPADVADQEKQALTGIETSDLGSREPRFHSILDSEPCPCAEPHSLAECLTGDHCRWAKPAARLVARSLRNGASDNETIDALRKRFGATKPAPVDSADAPTYGNAGAPVVIVEFSDFECPFCQHFAPVLKKAVDESGGKARLVYRFFPLARHTHAEAAARAAQAAHLQGKFWEMHDALFADQEHLETADFARRAQEIGLDSERFQKDFESAQAAARVATDKKDGEAHGVEGTPTLFFNGREFNDDRKLEALKRWIEDEAP